MKSAGCTFRAYGSVSEARASSAATSASTMARGHIRRLAAGRPIKPGSTSRPQSRRGGITTAEIHLAAAPTLYRQTEPPLYQRPRDFLILIAVPKSAAEFQCVHRDRHLGEWMPVAASSSRPHDGAKEGSDAERRRTLWLPLGETPDSSWADYAGLPRTCA
jgi:hypothetical protein